MTPGGSSGLELDLLILRPDMDLFAPHSSCLAKRPLGSSGLHSDREQLTYRHRTWQILSSWVAVSDYRVVAFMRLSFHLSRRSAIIKPLTDAAWPQQKLFVSRLTLSTIGSTCAILNGNAVENICLQQSPKKHNNHNFAQLWLQVLWCCQQISPHESQEALLNSSPAVHG